MALSQHETRTAPDLSGVLDLDGTEQAGLASTAPGRSVRGFRAVAFGEPYAETETHAERGNPDPRRDHVAFLPEPGTETNPLEFNNALALVVGAGTKAPPARARQGFTGADPSRDSTMRRPLFLRLFDKLIADHNTGIDKVQLSSPLAGQPYALADLAGGQPSAGGQTGTGSAGVGPQPNTFRVLPDQWDSLLINTGGAAPTEAAQPRGRFR